MKPAWTRARNEDGQAMVEAALTLPLICAFIFMTMEICLLFYSYCMISETARQGARYAMVHGAKCVDGNGASCTVTYAQINTYTQAIGWPNLAGGALTASTATAANSPSSVTTIMGQGSMVTVTVSYGFPVNLPFLPQGTLAMKSSSTTVILQ